VPRLKNNLKRIKKKIKELGKVKVYLIGSLRNKEVPYIADKIRALGNEIGIEIDVFDDWFAAGEKADDEWRDYEKEGRRRTFKAALKGLAAEHVFNFDLKHLNECDMAVLLLPAGKSGHIEFGYIRGQGKVGYIILDNPERWDVMYRFATEVFNSIDELLAELRNLFTKLLTE
jgi:nucleoside 2-deoxyribosyltransferase